MTAPSLVRRLVVQSSRQGKRPGYSLNGIKRVGRIIRAARIAKELNLDDVAEITGYSRASIGALETGRKGSEQHHNINVPLLMLLLEILEPVNPQTDEIYHPWDLLQIALKED